MKSANPTTMESSAPGTATSLIESNHLKKDDTCSGHAAGLRKAIKESELIFGCGANRKVFETLRAQFALAGFALFELSDGTLLATRWNLTRVLTDVHAALQFLGQIGGAR